MIRHIYIGAYKTSILSHATTAQHLFAGFITQQLRNICLQTLSQMIRHIYIGAYKTSILSHATTAQHLFADFITNDSSYIYRCI